MEPTLRISMQKEIKKNLLSLNCERQSSKVRKKKQRPAAQNPLLNPSSHYSATAICLADQQGPIQGGSAQLNAERTTL